LAIGIGELTRQGEVAIMRVLGNVLFIYSLIAGFYCLYCYLVLRLSKWTEDRFGATGRMTPVGGIRLVAPQRANALISGALCSPVNHREAQRNDQTLCLPVEMQRTV